MDTLGHSRDNEQLTPHYELLVELEDLESLLEELEEGGWDVDLKSADLPGEIQDRIDEAKITNLTELRDKIARLHASLDSSEDSEETS